MSAIFIYSLYGGLLAALVIAIYIFLTKKVADIKVNFGLIILSFFFIMALWLADLMTLSLSENGLSSKSGVGPISTVPDIFIYGAGVFAMISIHFFTQKLSRKPKNRKNLLWNSLWLNSQALGLIMFILFSIYLIFGGHNQTLGGYYLLVFYHASLSLLIFPQIVESVMLK